MLACYIPKNENFNYSRWNGGIWIKQILINRSGNLRAVIISIYYHFQHTATYTEIKLKSFKTLIMSNI
jgi:hypothetical protein